MMSAQHFAKCPLVAPNLTPLREHLAHYQREGWVPLSSLLSELGVAAAGDACDQMLQDEPEGDSHWLMDPHAGERGSWLMAILTDARVSELLHIFCGASVCLASSQFFVKPAAQGSQEPFDPLTACSRAVGWHQDGLDSVQGDFDRALGYQPVGPLTLWIAVDDVHPDNGGLLVLPRLHQQGQLPTGEMPDDSGVRTHPSFTKVTPSCPNQRSPSQVGVGIDPMVLAPHTQHAIAYRLRETFISLNLDSSLELPRKLRSPNPRQQ